jgi:hypothetical protein
MRRDGGKMSIVLHVGQGHDQMYQPTNKYLCGEVQKAIDSFETGTAVVLVTKERADLLDSGYGELLKRVSELPPEDPDVGDPEPFM